MCTENELDVILNYVTEQYSQSLGVKIKQIVLYGSYARGDFDEESDIDIVAIVDCDREDIASYHRKLAEISSELDLEYGIMVSPSVIPYAEFIKYKDDLPYYRNIAREGVVLSA